MKVCKACAVSKPLSEFYKAHIRQRCKDGKNPQCKQCCNEKTKAWRVANKARIKTHNAAKYARRRQDNPHDVIARGLLSGAKHRAKRANLPFDIDLEWILDRISTGKCEASGIPFVLTPESPLVPTLDQRVPGGGYTKENAQVVVYIYNVSKGPWAHEDVLHFAKALISGPIAL